MKASGRYRGDSKIPCWVLAGVAAFGLPAGAEEFYGDPSNYQATLTRLQPGDTLTLASGTYRHGLQLRRMAGMDGRPIVIRGPGDRSARFTANDCCNTVQLDTVAFIEIRNLTLDGAGTHGSFGVDSRGPCHDVILENLEIVNHGASQQVVGISTKGPAWNWVVRRNIITGAGTGMYLGNSDGTAPFFSSIVEYNLVTRSIGYAIQIKHQIERPAGLGLPTATSRTVIRHNVLSKQGQGGAGRDARPNLLVGHFPLNGPGAEDRYEIYGNFFFENPDEALFQGEGNLVVHDNVFVSSSGDAIRIVPHNARPRSVLVFHNTVVAPGTGILVEGADPAYGQRIFSNAVFSGRPVVAQQQAANVTDSFHSAARYLVAPGAALGQLDLYPLPGTLRLRAAVLDIPVEFSDAKVDFNGKERRDAFAGAYAGEGTNPGWRVALDLKPQSSRADWRRTDH